MVCYPAKADTFTKYFLPLELKKPQLIFMKKNPLLKITEKQKTHIKGQEKELKAVLKHRKK